MSFLQKMGLVEEGNTTDKSVSAVTSSAYKETAIGDDNVPSIEQPIDDSGFNISNLVQDVYSRSGDLTDTSKSVYKVSEFRDAMPKEMALPAKKSSVLNILKISGISVEDIEADAELRKKALTDALACIQKSNNDIITNAKADIEKCKAAIEELNSKIYNATNSISSAETSIDTETGTIDELVKFIGDDTK